MKLIEIRRLEIALCKQNKVKETELNVDFDQITEVTTIIAGIKLSDIITITRVLRLTKTILFEIVSL